MEAVILIFVMPTYHQTTKKAHYSLKGMASRKITVKTIYQPKTKIFFMIKRKKKIFTCIVATEVNNSLHSASIAISFAETTESSEIIDCVFFTCVS